MTNYYVPAGQIMTRDRIMAHGRYATTMVTVVSVHRVGDTVRVFTDTGPTRTFHRDDMLVLARRTV